METIGLNDLKWMLGKGLQVVVEKKDGEIIVLKSFLDGKIVVEKYGLSFDNFEDLIEVMGCEEWRFVIMGFYSDFPEKILIER